MGKETSKGRTRRVRQGTTEAEIGETRMGSDRRRGTTTGGDERRG